MLVAFGSGPHRRERHHVGEVEGRDRRLADIGVDVAGQAAEPGLDGVHALGDAGEVAALDDLLDQPQLLVGDAGVFVPDRDGRGHIGLADQVGAELLERRVGIHRLVVGVGIEQRRGLVGHHLLEDRDDRLALGEPLAADAGQDLGGVGLVERDGAGRPAIGKGQPVELVEDARMGRRRKSHHREGAQMRLAEPRLEPADERLVDQDRVEIHRHLGDADAVAPGRDAGMQIGQRLRVREPCGFRHEALDELQHPVGSVDEALENLVGVGPLRPGRGPRRAAPRRARPPRPAAGTGRSGNRRSRSERPPPRTAPGARHRPAPRPGRETRSADSSAPHRGWLRRRSPSRSRDGAARC